MQQGQNEEEKEREIDNGINYAKTVVEPIMLKQAEKFGLKLEKFERKKEEAEREENEKLKKKKRMLVESMIYDIKAVAIQDNLLPPMCGRQ